MQILAMVRRKVNKHNKTNPSAVPLFGASEIL